MGVSAAALEGAANARSRPNAIRIAPAPERVGDIRLTVTGRYPRRGARAPVLPEPLPRGVGSPALGGIARGPDAKECIETTRLWVDRRDSGGGGPRSAGARPGRSQRLRHER